MCSKQEWMQMQMGGKPGGNMAETKGMHLMRVSGQILYQTKTGHVNILCSYIHY